MQAEKVLLKGHEVAAALGCCRAMAYELMRSGVLPTVRLGRRAVRVPARALEKWIEQKTQGGDGR